MRTGKSSVRKGWMYILECSDGSYYTGSTNNLELRLQQHMSGLGSNHTRKHPPLGLIYVEEFDRVYDAFYREKQIQGWTKKKKDALIEGMSTELKKLAECMNESHCRNFHGGGVLLIEHDHAGNEDSNLLAGGFDSAQPPVQSDQPPVQNSQMGAERSRSAVFTTPIANNSAQPTVQKSHKGVGRSRSAVFTTPNAYDNHV